MRERPIDGRDAENYRIIRRQAGERRAALIERDAAEARAAAAEQRAETWKRCANYAMQLAMYGERAPGGDETWNEFERMMRDAGCAERGQHDPDMRCCPTAVREASDE